MSDNQQTAVSAVAAAHDAGLMMGFQNLAAFEFMQRVAKGFALSTMVPPQYQAVVSVGYGQNKKWEQNPAALSNCMVALDLAQRMGASPLQVMQNLHVIEGRPSWASPFIIALINNSGLYAHNLRFAFEWLGEVDALHYTYEWVNNVKTEVIKTVRVKNARCVAWTTDKNGERIESPEVTIEMAVAEGWYTRNGSKWRTMTQLMCQYRAAAFFGRTHNPELLMGLPTTDEMHDIIDVVPQADGTYAVPPSGAAEAGAPEASAPTPRAPRARQNPAPAAEAKAEPVVEPTPAPAPESVAEPAAAPEATAAPEQTPAAQASESLPQTITTTAEDEQRIDGLFDEAAAPTPAPAPPPTPAPAAAPAAKKTQASKSAAPKDAPAASTGTATATTTTSASSPALTPQKIAFVKAQLDTTGGWTTDDFTKKFGITPDALTVAQFPLVLAWFKEPKAA